MSTSPKWTISYLKRVVHSRDNKKSILRIMQRKKFHFYFYYTSVVVQLKKMINTIKLKLFVVL